MIKSIYNIEGMSCSNCVANVKSTLLKMESVNEAVVQLQSPQAIIYSDTKVPLKEIESILPKYTISVQNEEGEQRESRKNGFMTYKPLILIISFILLVCTCIQYPFMSFDMKLWMRHFMAGFFIVFSFFKFLNLKGFAENYAMYDIVAMRWKAWGFIFPFVELSLGILYLINTIPFLTGVITIAILSISSIGVIKSNLDKRKIKCACLGDIFDLPMSTVTIIEDVSMLCMAIAMLIF